MTSDQALEVPDLVVRKHIPARPERVFQAWTDPAELLTWWGPKDVTCIEATVDLRVDGAYCIGNRLPDNSIVWITGVFRRIEPSSLLSFTWLTQPEGSDSSPGEEEQVTVRFLPDGDGTLVEIRHQRIASALLREGHEAGWHGCLEGLAVFLSDGE